MSELGLTEYFGMAEALGNNCYIVFLKKANTESLSRHPNKGSQ
jgi:hypothetical protein